MFIKILQIREFADLQICSLFFTRSAGIPLLSGRSPCQPAFQSPGLSPRSRDYFLNRIIYTLGIALSIAVSAAAQENPVSKVWVADLGNGTYQNPILNADYSDPDVCRAGDDFYMIASSFNVAPGIPVLHSKDLINWKLIGHALPRQVPLQHFSSPQHGNGVWAPAIRYHKDEFWIYYPDPDFGIYLIKAKDPAGPWSDPVLVEEGLGLIDPCPFWDDNGDVYLVHGWAGSRAGIKSILTMKKLNREGTKVIDEGVIVYDGHDLDPTVEGPKMHKRNGYYYIFAPAGGVSTGWQLALRSKNVYGPYERKVVMHQGASPVNGPHQGAWVETQTGEDWFIHFQDKDTYGRVVHLQPMKWVEDWPVIGTDREGKGTGEPVMTHAKPNVGKTHPVITPPDSDEFDSIKPGLQWQWHANPSGIWYTTSNQGFLRLFSYAVPDGAKSLWDVPNLLLQKFPADEFVATTKLSFTPNTKLENERTGLVIMGMSYASLFLKSGKNDISLFYSTCPKAEKGGVETERKITTVGRGATIYLRVKVAAGGVCRFSYSKDGLNFIETGETFKAEPGKWIGAKVGLYCTRTNVTNDSGYADFDWFRVEKDN